MERTFEKRGLGYRMHLPELTAELAIDQLSRQRGELHGEITVTMAMPGTRSADGHLHQAHMNVSGSDARGRLAKVLRERAQTNDSIDWTGVLEDFCRHVLAAERDGEPAIRVGTLPRPTRIEYRLDPIVAAGKPVLLYGRGGTGKSTIASAFAVSVETGVTVIEGFIPRKANVLYLDWEADRDEVNERVRGVAMGANLPSPASILYRQCYGPLYRQVEPIARIVAKEDIGLVIVDSVGMAAGIGSEGGDAAEVALKLFGAFRALTTTRPGCAILGIHHITKTEAGDDGKQSKPYGSVYFENLSRATFELRASSDGLALGLYNTKPPSYGPRLAPMALSITHEEDGTIRYGRMDSLPEELTRSLPLAERIYRLLAVEKLDPGEIADTLDEPPNKVRAILSRHNAKLFGKLASGKWEALPRAS
jgi:hypothetical protein